MLRVGVGQRPRDLRRYRTLLWLILVVNDTQDEKTSTEELPSAYWLVDISVENSIDC